LFICTYYIEQQFKSRVEILFKYVRPEMRRN
jgi:hypothetical protein